MSDSQGYESITVASDGVTVTKRFEADEFPVPAIAFQFDSERTEPVTVRLTDVVPDAVAVEDLGFHPEYGSEYWTIDDDQIAFERELEPDAEYTTVYGIRATGTDNVEQFLTDPTLESVDPPLAEDEEALVGEGSDAVRNVISGESDEVPGLEDEEEDVATLELNEPAVEEAPGNGSPETAETVIETNDDDDAPRDLVAALANQIRSGAVDESDLAVLRKALGVDESGDDSGGEPSGSTRAKLSKLQEDVDEVLAYAGALEEFLDENGTAEETVGEFSSELDAVRSDVDDVQSGLGEVRSDVAAVEETAAANEEDVASIGSTMNDLENQIASLEGEVADLREQVGDGEVNERIDAIDDEIAELKAWREQLSSVIGGSE